eukprot:363531-Chlamydomonas_euryale.AAC.1
MGDASSRGVRCAASPLRRVCRSARSTCSAASALFTRGRCGTPRGGECGAGARPCGCVGPSVPVLARCALRVPAVAGAAAPTAIVECPMLVAGRGG